jgi:hypothetical protein
MSVGTAISPSGSGTNQIAVIKAFRALLLDRVDQLTESNLFISDSDDPPPAGSNHWFWARLWVLGGEFDEGVFLGSGQNDVREAAGISVWVYRSAKSDRSGQEAEVLTGDKPTALLRLKHQMLKAVAGQQLFWEQQPLLTELVRPIASDHPRTEPAKTGKRAAIYMEFATPFQWNMQVVP